MLHVLVAAFVVGFVAYTVKVLLLHVLKKQKSSLDHTAIQNLEVVKPPLKRHVTFRPPSRASIDREPTQDDWLLLRNDIYKFRVLPPPSNESSWFHVVRQHYINPNVAPITCLKEFVDGKWQGDCVACDHWKNLWSYIDQTTNDSDREQLKLQATRCKARERYYFNVLPVLSDRCRLLSVSKQVFDDMRIAVESVEDVDIVKVDIFDSKTEHIFGIEKKMRAVGFPSFRVMYKSIPATSDTQLFPPTWDLDKVTSRWRKPVEDVIKTMQISDIGYCDGKVFVNRICTCGSEFMSRPLDYTACDECKRISKVIKKGRIAIYR